MATPFGAWGGEPNVAGPGMGFNGYLGKKGYSSEANVIQDILRATPEEQVMLDIQLNMNAIPAFPNSGQVLTNNSRDKLGLIPIFRGKVKNPRTIKYFIGVVEDSIKSHYRQANPVTGSDDWNGTWIKVYKKWLKILYKILGDINGSQNGGY
jgi:hypothetical protein